jgi:RNA recognition motif-containing protein
MNEDELKQVFASFGTIEEAKIIQNRFTGRSRGFGFVAFSNESEAQKALEANGTEVKGRKLFVNIAREKTEHAPKGRKEHSEDDNQ